MSGPAPAPAAPPRVPMVPAAAARELAVYAAQGMTLLAPRGWHCREAYGSGGAVLLVTPRSYAADDMPGFDSLAGPALELSFLNGENSGRDQVAEVFSRLFPFKRRFIRGVENADDAHRFPRGPYPVDSTVRRSRSEVDYTTPAHHQGMGTFDSRLKPGDDPITGLAILAQSNGVDSVVLLNLRLPSRWRALAPAILDAVRTLRAGGAR